MSVFPYRTPRMYWINDPTFKIYGKVSKWVDENFAYDEVYKVANVEYITYFFKRKEHVSFFLLNWPNLDYVDDD
jgi:hypothetical protein